MQVDYCRPRHNKCAKLLGRDRIMKLPARSAIIAFACIAGVTGAHSAFAEGKPYTPPIRFDYALIPVKGCVLRPTSNPANTEMDCRLDAKAIAQCNETKGELGSIDGQLMCRTPRVAAAAANPAAPPRPGAAVTSPIEPPSGPDAAGRSPWRPKIIKVRTRP